jgi:hypothetical protein
MAPDPHAVTRSWLCAFSSSGAFQSFIELKWVVLGVGGAKHSELWDTGHDHATRLNGFLWFYWESADMLLALVKDFSIWPIWKITSAKRHIRIKHWLCHVTIIGFYTDS